MRTRIFAKCSNARVLRLGEGSDQVEVHVAAADDDADALDPSGDFAGHSCRDADNAAWFGYDLEAG